MFTRHTNNGLFFKKYNFVIFTPSAFTLNLNWKDTMLTVLLKKTLDTLRGGNYKNSPK